MDSQCSAQDLLFFKEVLEFQEKIHTEEGDKINKRVSHGESLAEEMGRAVCSWDALSRPSPGFPHLCPQNHLGLFCNSFIMHLI